MNRQQLVAAGIATGGGRIDTPTGYLFDQGSYSAFAEVSTGVYRITPRKHWNNSWAWWALRSGQFSGKTPHFVIAKANHYNMVTGEWLACWATSPDTNTWTPFDNVTIGAVDLEFYHNTAFPGGTIYIAAMPMYPFSRTQRKATEWGASVLTGETPSTTNKILGNATARDNGDGREAGALPFYGFKISSGAGTKNNGVLTSGTHPSETPGRYMLEGAVDWLLTTGSKQKMVLDYFNFYVYPALNPQGITGGWFRSSPQTPDTDNNRLWDATGTNEAVDAYKTAWAADFSNAIEVGFDYHSWMAADGNRGLTADSTTALWVAYIAALKVLDPAFSARPDDPTASMSFNYWQSLNAGKLIGSLDHGSAVTLGPSDWYAAGQRSMIAVANMLAAGYFTNSPAIGSRSFNGTTDRIDYASPATLTGSPVTISAWVNSDGYAGAADYTLCLHRAGDTAIGMVLALGADGQINFYRNGTTALNVFGIFGAGTFTGAWHNVIATHDGTITDATRVHIYRDNVEAGSYGPQTSGAGEYAPTGSASIGGRKFDDLRNFDGKQAQIGVWNRVLTGDERTNLAAGYAPSLIPDGLIFYFSANTASLEAVPGGTGTADGTAQLTGVGNGPAIIYP